MKTKILFAGLLALLFFILFCACKKEELATLTTLSVSEITSNSAQSGGNISNDGGGEITSRGVVWATHDNPSIEQHSGISIDGGGTGLFTSNIATLSSNTTYYVRAYAVNGAGTAYGNQAEFTTKDSDTGSWPRDTQTQVVEVTNPATGKTWMDRNLGASRAAISSTDAQAYGDLYQWGREADGHQKRTSGTTSTLSGSNTPGHGSFITTSSSPYDWRNPQNDNLWQGVNGVNNPCPPGYRLPTDAELNAERQSWSSNNTAGAFASPLKLPVAGYRRRSNGSFNNVDSSGFYWSSTVDGSRSRYLFFNSSDALMLNDYRAHGFSVRCFKD